MNQEINKIIKFEPGRCGIRHISAYDLNTIKDFAHAFDKVYTEGFHKEYIDGFTDNVQLCNWIIKRFPIRKTNYNQNYKNLLKKNNKFRNARFTYPHGNQLAMLLNKNCLKLRNAFNNLIIRNQQIQTNINISILGNLYDLLIVTNEIEQKYSNFLQNNLFAYEENLGILSPAA